MSRTAARAQHWRDVIGDWVGGAWRWLLMAAGVVVAVYVLMSGDQGNTVVLATALAALVVGVAVTRSTPLAIALMAVPALVVVERVGGGGLLSVSDAALAAGFGTAVLMGKRPYSAPLRALLLLNLIYQFATVFTVIVNPYPANTIEWFHAWLLISGSLIMGWALGRGGYARLSLLLLVSAACVVAVGTVVTGLVQYAGGDFAGVYPVWPFAMHKNAAGTIMAFMALIAWVRPAWARLPVGPMRLAFWLLIIAIVMTQSRQAIIGLIVAMVVLGARRGAARRSRWVLLLVIPAIWLVIVTVIDQINSQNQFNSFFQRVDWFREVYLIWRDSPLFGQGLRFWYLDPSSGFQPPQAELEVLASAGIVGLIGFTVMWLGIVVVLWRVDPRFGSLALGVVLTRIVQAQFDLFWVAGQTSIPFVIAGICLGAQALAAQDAARDGAAARVGEKARSRLRTLTRHD